MGDGIKSQAVVLERWAQQAPASTASRAKPPMGRDGGSKPSTPTLTHSVGGSRALTRDMSDLCGCGHSLDYRTIPESRRASAGTIPLRSASGALPCPLSLCLTGVDVPQVLRKKDARCQGVEHTAT